MPKAWNIAIGALEKGIEGLKENKAENLERIEALKGGIEKAQKTIQINTNMITERNAFNETIDVEIQQMLDTIELLRKNNED